MTQNIENIPILLKDGAKRDRLDPILDICVKIYTDDHDEDQQVDFKGKAKTFTRAYNYLSAIFPFNSAEWEKLTLLRLKLDDEDAELQPFNPQGGGAKRSRSWISFPISLSNSRALWQHRME